jgi:hypothetical protein
MRVYVVTVLIHVDVCVWLKLEYRIDVCRVTRGAHIEHLLVVKTFSWGCEQFH